MDRRAFLAAAAATALAGASGAQATEPSTPLPPAEKQRLKEELQRELERRVYSVDEALFRKVNRAQSPGQLVGHERSHVPKVVAPARVRRLEPFGVRVEVGVDELHEMQAFHYVDWIRLDVEGVQVNGVSLTPVVNRPVVTFELVLEQAATLRALEHCNLHGTWESEPWRVEVE